MQSAFKIHDKYIFLPAYFEYKSTFKSKNLKFLNYKKIIMNNKSEAIIHNKPAVGNIISWLFGIAVFAAGVINTFWGNDSIFGVFLVLLSFIYFPLVNVIVRKRFSLLIPVVVKIILGIFIIWAALGVGELFAKIDLMMLNF